MGRKNKKLPKAPKRRNMEAYGVIFRHKNGGSAGFHGSKRKQESKDACRKKVRRNDF
jgi:hypothetical protein